MSQETFELVKEMDVTNVETRLVLQCAPFISGLKISNLLIVSIKDEALIRIILQRAGISFFRLLRTEEKVTFLLFQRFDGAKEDMIQLLSKGVGMQDIIDSYKDNRLFEESLDIPEQAVV